MLFWIISLLMCSAGIMMVLWPLGRRSDVDTTDAGGLDLYRAQLADVESRIAAGRGEASVLEEERTEIARRILKADREGQKTDKQYSSGRISRLIAAIATIVAVPLVTFSLYAMQGAPGVADKPLASVQSQTLANQSVDQLVKRAEDHLAENPDDPKGWQVLAGVYQRLNRPLDRARALQNLIRLTGDTPDLLADLGEAIAISKQNIISQRSKKLFLQALQKDSMHRKARFYIALSLEQEGKFEKAKAIWMDLAKLDPDNPQWQAMINSRIITAVQNGASDAARGPSEADIKAASNRSADERQTMIQGMVENLASRLADEPGDIAGWQRLVNAYSVLKQRDKALSSIERAEAHFRANPEDLAKLAALRQQLDLPERKKQ